MDDIFRLRGEDFLGALAERTSLSADRVGFDELSPSEAALLDVWALEAEVNNGGFDQYFFNSSGDRARGALAGLELIGAGKTAAIVRRALAVFGRQGPAPSRAARWEQMDRWEPEVEATLDALDTEFYAYPEPLAELMERHCRAHREAFAR
ncbi:DMP19 family protein [Anaeromyxobacter sp. PSR-1]|uniref:DMP19 family protein n=1 Tax=Anaeromyxobacter sp. PSR-1 TaxID=1300915 RepID=UPI0009E3916E